MNDTDMHRHLPILACLAPLICQAAEATCPDSDLDRRAFFGDLHVHTSFSFDAAANTTGATPEDANRFAKGEPIAFWPLSDSGEPVGAIQIDRPLDFLAVTDHGEFLGERSICRTPDSPAYDTEFCTTFRSDERIGMLMLGAVITTETPERVAEICGEDGLQCLEYAETPWRQVQAAANEANEPCAFTSFIAYEYTGTPMTSNYHRNVIFRGASVPDLPVSYIDAPTDTELWARLDKACGESNACDYLTIPHNTNLANGRMAPYRGTDASMAAKRGYAATRLAREPIMEIFQHKGGSECINGLTSVLGAPDELCAVEAVRHMGETVDLAELGVDVSTLPAGLPQTATTEECAAGEVGAGGMLGAGCVDATDFQRSALLVGLREEQAIGQNPIKLGVIAATDTHTATPGAVSESDWRGAVSQEATSAERLEPGLLTSGIDGNPGGIAGIWAEENTREALFDAMLRREVFGTSGPRIRMRLFAGWDIDEDLCERADMVAAAYRQGVPMGGDLRSGDGKPRILAYAVKDPMSEDLTDLQLIKGWVGDDGGLHSQVLSLVSAPEGEASLCAVYTDEDFNPRHSTYYYLRAVEPPLKRWHTYDCERLSGDERPAVCDDGRYPEEIREMAWSSPIWYKAQ